MALKMRPSGLVLEERKILAWYDTTPVYSGLAFLSLGTVILSLTGIKVARDIAAYNKYVWVPYLLLGLSTVLAFFCGSRLSYRLFLRFRDRDY